MNEQNNTNIPQTPPHLFSVVNATRRSFLFISEEWRYLARLSVPAICLQLVLSMGLFMYDKEASGFTVFMVEMPATVFLGWFIFALVRLIVFGERLHSLPIKDVRFMQYRAQLMKATILLLILFRAGSTVIAEIATNVSHMNPQEAMPPQFVFLAIASVVFVFWALRFFTMPLLAAVDYPLMTFLKQAKGFAFSFKLFGLMLMCTLPIFFLLNALVLLLIDNPAIISDTELLIIAALQAPFSVIISAIVSAGVTFGLKEMLGQNKEI